MISADLRIRPLAPRVGAEISGLNLHEPLDDFAATFLRRACARFSVLVVRGQRLSTDEQLRFAEVFGPVIERESVERASYVTASAEIGLHFDHWLTEGYPQPLRYTLLYGMEVAPTGGETFFASARGAYETLPDGIRSRLNGLKAVHCYDYSPAPGTLPRSRVREADLPPGQPQATFAVVHRHPESGEPLLYVSPKNTDRIAGLSPAESESLLAQLWEYVQLPENMYEHRWRADDLVIWDNYAVLHGRRGFDPKYRRRLRRMSIR